MNEILYVLAEITVYASILMVGILIFQKVFEKKVSARLRNVLWILLILRLLIPITFDSQVRIIQINSPAEKFVQQVQQVKQTQQPDNTQNSQQVKTVSPIYKASNEPEKTKQTIDLATVILAVWIAGITVFALRTLWLHSRFRKCIKRNELPISPHIQKLLDKCRQNMNISQNIPLSIQKNLETPALTVSLRPKLLLPISMLNDKNNNVIHFAIQHELTHFVRKDHILSLLLICLRCVYWFNPLIWFAFRRMNTDMEIACDEQVSARLCKEDKKEYAKAILDIPEENSVNYALGMSKSKGRVTLERRIRGIFMKKKTKRTALIPVILLSAMMIMMCFTTACQPVIKTALAGDSEKTDAITTVSLNPSSENETPATEASDESSVDVVPTPTPQPTLAPAPTPDPALMTDDSAIASEEDYIAPPTYITAFTEDEVRTKTIDAIKKIFGEDVSGKKVYIINNLSEPLTGIEVAVGGKGEGQMNDAEYLGYLDPKTGVVISIDKRSKQVKGLDDVPTDLLEATDKLQDKQKVADIALDKLKNLVGGEVQAYFIDAVQALFDENDSIMTDCHILLKNKDYYTVGIVYPGYTVKCIYKNGDDSKFLTKEQIEKFDFEVAKWF